MANLETLIRYQRFAPDLGANRELEKPFFVELAVGMTKLQLKALADTVDTVDEKATGMGDEEYLEHAVKKMADALAPYVKMGTEPLVVNGKRIETLSELLTLYATLASGPAAMLELSTALRWFNSIGGATALFFERLSGGSVSTTPRSGAQGGKQRAAH